MGEQGAGSESAASKTVTLGIMQQRYILGDTTEYIQDMLNVMAKAWKPPTNPAGIDKWQNDIGNTLQRLPAWARQGSDSTWDAHHCAHQEEGLGLALHASCEPDEELQLEGCQQKCLGVMLP